MEKINIAELLKDCPKGIELDCYLFNGLEFDHIDTYNENYPIVCRAKNSKGEYNIHTFTEYGWYSAFFDYSKCVIFPKGKTTWKGFQRPYINGDIVYTIGGSIAILGDKIGEYSESFYSHCGLFYDEFDFDIVVSPERLATEEEKTSLFQAIKANGYNWNSKTKTLEKKFKVGDRITNGDITSVIKQITKDSYILDIKDNEICFNYVFFRDQDKWELVSSIKPKFKVGDRIRKKNSNEEYIIISINDYTYYYRLNEHCTGSLGIQLQDDYELVPKKFDINTLVAFESRVLIRDTKSQKWSPAIWGFYDSDHQDYQYKLVGVIARYCIPYEGNEHLLGKADDCDEYFKTWK